MKESFDNAWRRLGARAGALPDFAELAARYGEPHRAYHTLEHIHECQRWFGAVRHLAVQPFEVEVALMYHDIVYEPRRSDNELRSAKLFRVHAAAAGLPAKSTRRIVALIEGTASHSERSGDGALLSDIDLAVLGSSPHQYERFERRVRREYAHVEERQYRNGRRQILRSFLELTPIYASSFFEGRLEAQARWNLSHALTRLDGSG